MHLGTKHSDRKKSTASKVKFEGNHNIMVVAVSMVVGLIPIGVSGFYQKFPDALQIVLNSGIMAGSVTAIVLNLLLNELVSKPKTDEVTDAALGRPLEEFGYGPGESS